MQGTSGRFGSAGVGMRGPGETKLELNRRVLEKEMDAAVAEASAAIAGKPYGEAQATLRDVTVARTTDATARYKQLGDYLFVKYLDGNIKKEADGKFARTADGMPEQPVFGGYNERYFRSIVEDAGERLKVPEIKL